MDCASPIVADGEGAFVSWWLEDAAPNTVLVHPSGRTFGDADQLMLAWITDNRSDLHGNVARAANGEFGGLVVLGALTVAVVIGLAQPAEPDRARVRWRPAVWRRIALEAPVRVGDTVWSESTVVALGRTDRRGGEVTRTIHGRNQRGEIVAEIEEVAWVPRRPGRARQRIFDSPEATE
jgi:itaconyl-CoA hydratase